MNSDPELQGPDEPLPEDDDEPDETFLEDDEEDEDELEEEDADDDADDDEVDVCPFCGEEDCDNECQDGD